jgi:hypothetical protein
METDYLEIDPLDEGNGLRKDSKRRKKCIETIFVSYFLDGDDSRRLWEDSGSRSYFHARIKQYP